MGSPVRWVRGDRSNIQDLRFEPPAVEQIADSVDGNSIREKIMNLGILLFVVHDLVAHLVTKGLLSVSGTVTGLTVKGYIELGGAVVKSLREHGITIRAEIDSILMVLPLILGTFGVKSLTGEKTSAAFKKSVGEEGIPALTLAEIEGK